MFKVRIETKNEEHPQTEIIRILSRELITALICGKEEGELHDTEGNVVGGFRITKDDKD
jgi:hypothetical protein